MNQKKVVFKSRLKDYTTEHFWSVVKADAPNSVGDIERYRALVLNPFSHYNTERHEIKAELENAIQAIKNLKSELDSNS